MGSGRIDGRPVMVAAEDFTVKAGTISQAANSKRYRVAEIAVADRVPLVMMLEGAGYRADGRPHARTPTDLLAQARCSGRVPLVTAVLGASAGHGALVAPMSDFTVMSEHGVDLHRRPARSCSNRSGETDHQGGPRRPVGRDRERADPQRGPRRRGRARPRARVPALLPVVRVVVPARRDGRRRRAATRARDARHRAAQRAARLRHARRDRRRLRRATRRSRCSPSFGQSMVCALARLGGHPVAVVANQPQRPRRIDRRRRRRQGRALHHRRRLVPPAARVPRRQPRRAARQRLRAPGHPAQRRAHVRRADARRRRRSSR